MANEFITTVTGKRLYPMKPHPDQIDIRDIASGLSKVCRFSGQCPVFYSVGQHSVTVAEILETPPDTRLLPPQPLDMIRMALLHDAVESYIGDVPTPAKQFLPLYEEMEGNIMAAVFEKFGLEPLKELPEPIKIADAIALKTEFRDLIPHGSNVYPKIPPANFTITPLRTPEQARAYFLNKFVELFVERKN